MNIISITTDFNDQFAISQLHAVIDANSYPKRLIENHHVTPYSIVEGSYAIWQLTKFLSKGTINVGVIDPGVGSERDGIIIQTNNFWFVGPNNGLFWESVKKDGFKKAWKINEKYFGKVATTFHGRDVFIKVALLLSKNISPQKFLCDRIGLERIVKLNFVESQIVHIDFYGNIKVWGENSFNLPVVNTFTDIPVGQLGILKGSSDTLEIFINQGSAKKFFKVEVGDIFSKKLKKL